MPAPQQKAVVIAHDGGIWGPFDGGREAALWAEKKWPDQDNIEYVNGAIGWRVQGLQPPDLEPQS